MKITTNKHDAEQYVGSTPFREESSPHAVEVAHRQVVIRELSCTQKREEKKGGCCCYLMAFVDSPC